MPSTTNVLKTASFQLLAGELEQLKLSAKSNRMSVSELLRRFTHYGLANTQLVLDAPIVTTHDMDTTLTPRLLQDTLTPLPPRDLVPNQPVFTNPKMKTLLNPEHPAEESLEFNDPLTPTYEPFDPLNPPVMPDIYAPDFDPHTLTPLQMNELAAWTEAAAPTTSPTDLIADRLAQIQAKKNPPNSA